MRLATAQDEPALDPEPDDRTPCDHDWRKVRENRHGALYRCNECKCENVVEA